MFETKTRQPLLYSPQQGGTIVSDVAKLSIPLGLILSQKGLQKLMSRSKGKSSGLITRADHANVIKPRPRSPSPTSKNKVRSRAALSGGSPGKKTRSRERIKRATSPTKKASIHHIKSMIKTKIGKRIPHKDASIREHFLQIAHRVQGIFARARIDKKSKEARSIPDRIKRPLTKGLVEKNKIGTTIKTLTRKQVGTTPIQRARKQRT